MTIIAPSILNANNLHLARDIDKTIEAGIDRVHIDIMDGHFVPNLSYGKQLVKDFKLSYPMIGAEVHLMSNNLDTLLPGFVEAGCDLLEFHFEATDKPGYWLDYLKANGVQAGIVVNPSTPVTALEPFIDSIDQVLIMSVEPGFGGQKFIPASLDKIAAAKQMLQKHQSAALVEVDGGINDQTAKLAANAGADIVVAGSYIFAGGNIGDNVRHLNEVMAK